MTAFNKHYDRLYYTGDNRNTKYIHCRRARLLKQIRSSQIRSIESTPSLSEVVVIYEIILVLNS